jgi:hypothetical protein
MTMSQNPKGLLITEMNTEHSGSYMACTGDIGTALILWPHTGKIESILGNE